MLRVFVFGSNPKHVITYDLDSGISLEQREGLRVLITSRCTETCLTWEENYTHSEELE